MRDIKFAMRWNKCMNDERLYHSSGRRTPAKGVVLSGDMPLILFCTVCTEHRGSWVTQKVVKQTLHDLWLLEARAWLVGPYVLMPDHIHFMCIPQDLSSGVEIERWAAFWKDRFARRVGQPEWRWQRGLFHHRLHNDSQLQDKLTYMRQNPVKRGLVDKAEAWPWDGEVHDLQAIMQAFGNPSGNGR